MEIEFLYSIVMKKKYAWLISALLLLGFSSFYIYNNVLYKDLRNIQNEKPAFSISTSDLANDYLSNSSKADLKYLNKTIEIEGKVTEALDSTLTLDHKVFCKMNQIADPNSINKKIKIKGRCIGFDDLFGLIKLDQCNNNN